MKDSTARAMENLETASEGVRLWVTYCERVGVDDDFHGRFKVMHLHVGTVHLFAFKQGYALSSALCLTIYSSQYRLGVFLSLLEGHQHQQVA